MLLEDVAGSDHHPGCLDTVERSALLLLHQDLINKTNQLTNGSIVFNIRRVSFTKASTFKLTVNLSWEIFLWSPKED